LCNINAEDSGSEDQIIAYTELVFLQDELIVDKEAGHNEPCEDLLADHRGIETLHPLLQVGMIEDLLMCIAQKKEPKQYRRKVYIHSILPAHE
jgi:hypothetical protein